MIVVLVLFASCSSKDAQFCECLSASDALNEHNQQFFKKVPTKQDQENALILKSLKDEACKDYQEMGGEEMRVKKLECEE